MVNISASVGDWSANGVKNNWEDVETVQELLQLAAKKTNNMDYHPGFADGIILPFASRTVECIRAFQSRFMRHPDGVISSGYNTIRKLSEFENKGKSTPSPSNAPSNATVNGAGCCFPLARLPSNSYQKPTSGKHYRGCYFGAKRFSKKHGGYRKHAGCDLKVPYGTPIFAVDDGEVHWVSQNFITGKRDNGDEWAVGAVTIIHNNFTVRYAEIKPNPPVERFDQVKKGQKIAEVGMMSRSKMLHFEMYSSNKKGGSLTLRNKKLTKEFGADTPFQRRADLIDPTSYLDQWKNNMPKIEK